MMFIGNEWMSTRGEGVDQGPVASNLSKNYNNHENWVPSTSLDRAESKQTMVRDAIRMVKRVQEY
jgi:hypothetical protein